MNSDKRRVIEVKVQPRNRVGVMPLCDIYQLAVWENKCVLRALDAPSDMCEWCAPQRYVYHEATGAFPIWPRVKCFHYGCHFSACCCEQIIAHIHEIHSDQ